MQEVVRNTSWTMPCNAVGKTLKRTLREEYDQGKLSVVS